MKITDDKGRLFGKINIVDMGVILLIILAAVSVGYKLTREKEIERKEAVISYTLCVEGVRDQSFRAISQKSEVYQAETGEDLGVISDIEKENAKKLVQKADGEYAVATYPDKFDLYITIESPGTVTQDGYFTQSGKKILYGDTIGISNGYSQMFGVVENISIKNN